MAIDLYTIGAWSQVLGCLITGIGFALTWRHYGTEGFFDFATKPIAATFHGTQRWLRRRFGKEHAVAPAGVASGSANVGAILASAWRPVPSGADLRQAIAEMNRCLDELRTIVHDGDRAAAAELARLDGQLRAIEARLAVETERLTQLSRTIAVGGIRLSSTGLVLIAVGVLLQLYFPASGTNCQPPSYCAHVR